MQDANEFFLVLGIVGLFVYGLLAYGVFKVSELKLLSLSFVIAAAGCFILVRLWAHLWCISRAFLHFMSAWVTACTACFTNRAVCRV